MILGAAEEGIPLGVVEDEDVAMRPVAGTHKHPFVHKGDLDGAGTVAGAPPGDGLDVDTQVPDGGFGGAGHIAPQGFLATPP